MANKKSLHLFLGIVLIFLGAVAGFIVARAVFNMVRKTGGLANPWLIGNLTLLAALGAFCVWIGTREFQRATAQEVRKPRLRWGKMLPGVGRFCLFGISHCPEPQCIQGRQPRRSGGHVDGNSGYGAGGIVASSFGVQTARI